MVFRTIGNAIGAVFATLFTGVIAFGVAVIVLAAAGPISLGFLNPQLRQALGALDLGFIIQMDDTQLSWRGWERRLDIRIIGLRFIDKSGVELSRLPSISIGLSGKHLLTGDLVVSKLEAFAPKVRIHRDKAGKFRFGLGDGPGDEKVALALIAAMAGSSSGTQRQLRRIEVLSANVQINDELRGIKGDLNAIDLLLDRRGDGVMVKADGAIAVRGMNIRFHAETLFQGQGKSLPVRIDLTGFNLAGLVRTLNRAEFANLQVEQAPVNVSADFSIDGNGRLVAPTVQFKIGVGQINWPEHFLKPLQFEAFQAQLGLLPNSDKIAIKAAELKLTKGPRITFTGSFTPRLNNYQVKLNGGFNGLPLHALALYWPRSLGQQAWNWVRKNISKGQVTTAKFSFDMRQQDFTAPRLPDRFVVLDFRFKGLKANYFAPLTPLTAIRGRGRLTANNLRLTLPSARIGKIKLSKGKLSISNLSARAPVLRAQFLAAAPTPDLLKYLDVPIFSGFRDLPFRSNAVLGSSVTAIDLKLPLGKRIRAADLQYNAKSELTNVAIKDLFGKMTLDQGTMSIAIDAKGMVAKGRGILSAQPVSFIWSRMQAKGKNPPITELRVDTVLTEASRDRLGVDLGKYLKGDLPLRLFIDPKSDGSMAIRGKIDLGRAELRFPASGWFKKSGRKGHLSFVSNLVSGQPIILRSVLMEAAGLRARGSLYYGDGRVKVIDIKRLQFNKNDLSVNINLKNQKKIIVVIGGKRIDARKFIKQFMDNAETGTIDVALGLKMTITELLVADKITLSEAVVLANWRNGGISGLTSRAKVNNGAPFSADLRTLENGHRSLEIWTGDGGAVLHGLGFFDNAKGGKLRVTVDIPAKMSAKSVVKGQLRGDDFLVAKAKVLGRVLSEASLAQALDQLSGDGVRFTRVDAPFEYDGNRILLKNARAVGPSLGVTLRGLMYQKSGKLDLQGTIIPAYTLNSFLGKIPFIGPFLIGGEVGGLFAVTYRIKGTSDTPEVSINPLSALAPGFFRAIIAGFDAPIMDSLDGTKSADQIFPNDNSNQN